MMYIITLTVSQGRQEDAEEYLGFILNGLHEEMVALKKLISPQEESMFLSDFCTSLISDSPSVRQIYVLPRIWLNFLCPQTEAPTPNGPESQPGVEEDPAEKQEDGSEDEWEQVGPKNKTSITRQADFIRTPITDIFGGHIR